MSASSLREIEKTLTALWMNRDFRESFLAGDQTQIDEDLAAQIDRDGVELYAGLLNYGHHDVLSSIFPLCEKLLRHKWEPIVDQYLATFPPNHFNLNQTAKRFPQFIAEHLPESMVKYPFLCELADYEWVELEMLECAEIVCASELDILQTTEQFNQYAPIANPALSVRRYCYPILNLAERLEGAKRKPGKVSAKETFVVIYRDPSINRCRFLEVGPVAAALLEKSHNSSTPYCDLITMAVSMSANADPQKVISDFLGLVENFQTNHLFMGNKKIN